MMNLYFNLALAQDYTQESQKIRVMSEHWLEVNLYCPACGNYPLTKFPNNKPIADFHCEKCGEQFELKSKKKRNYVDNRIACGGYQAMMKRIQSDNNPNFLLLSYTRLDSDYHVQELTLIPKHFISKQMIIPRSKGLPNRPNYIMCSLSLKELPASGKITLIRQGQWCGKKEEVLAQWRENLFLRDQKTETRGWLLAVKMCLDKLPENFTLAQVYEFELILSKYFPENHHVKEKIRQQLQLLRDKGVIEFLGKGKYRKRNYLI